MFKSVASRTGCTLHLLTVSSGVERTDKNRHLGIWWELGVPFHHYFFFKTRRTCYCISYKMHLLFMVRGLKIKKCAKTFGDQTHPQHVFLGLQCYVFTHLISTVGNALLKVGIYFERIAMVTKAGPKFCIQHSKMVFLQQETWAVTLLLEYHIVLWFKHSKKNESRYFKRCQAMESLYLKLLPCIFTHCSYTNCTKKEISSPFCLHLDKDSALWNGETYCEVLNQGCRFLYKKYWTLLQKSLALYAVKNKCLAQTSESTSISPPALKA